jgi:hypothetical protein
MLGFDASATVSTHALAPSGRNGPRRRGTDQFAAFYGDLSAQEQARVDKAIRYLEEFGHSLGRLTPTQLLARATRT